MSQNSTLNNKGLCGRSVFLSASVPDPNRSEEFRQIRDARLLIEEAVVSLARAVFGAGGRLVFGGHPSISPLVGLVASEYVKPRPPESSDSSGLASKQNEIQSRPLVTIYQSEAFRNVVPFETWTLFKQGYAELRWSPAVEGELYDPSKKGVEQCPNSLEAMRLHLLHDNSPCAIVCIGGMEGIFSEAELFTSWSNTSIVYAFGETGGASQKLDSKIPARQVRYFDREVLHKINEIHSENPGLREETVEGIDDENAINIIPFSLICQRLVEEISNSIA